MRTRYRTKGVALTVLSVGERERGSWRWHLLRSDDTDGSHAEGWAKTEASARRRARIAALRLALHWLAVALGFNVEQLETTPKGAK